MSDRDDLNLTLYSGMKAAAATRATVTDEMVDGGLDPDEAAKRVACKEQESKRWIGRAAWFIALAFIIIIGGLGLVTKLVLGDTAVSVIIVIGIIFGIGAGLAVAVALYCATQSSAELVRTYLGFLPLIRGLFNKGTTP